MAIAVVLSLLEMLMSPAKAAGPKLDLGDKQQIISGFLQENVSMPLLFKLQKARSICCVKSPTALVYQASQHKTCFSASSAALL